MGNIPWRAAIALTVTRTVICEGRMLNRRMKSDVRDVYSRSKRHAKRLDGAIEVLIIERVFVVPDASSGIGDFVAHEPDTIVSRIGLNPIYSRARPRHDSRLLPHGRAYATKTKRLIDAGYVVSPIRSVIVHVALPRMTLAPGIFVWDDVLRLSKIRRSGVKACVQVVNINQNPVRCCVMNVAAVIVRCRTRKNSGERIDPGARTDAGLAAV